ncbi:hypothetical protein [Vampirovibrio chlorellavorus]|uniref:hypothetical protein n=1 Tax=Vampirovibrio chlorellavorus TaxID=758823 RepID=UPI0026ECB836|nr:hypothetical protein [Vampirovibrio chlorellavorus]
MGGLVEQAGLARTVELKGHVIDSLTLSKVIDRVQQLGGDYRINDIHVGSLKKDISSINLTLLAPDADTLERLLEAVTPYGAVPEVGDAETLLCAEDGMLSEEAYRVRLPRKIRQNGQWAPVENGNDWCLRIQNGQAQMIPVAQVRKGDTVVRGAHGLDW